MPVVSGRPRAPAGARSLGGDVHTVRDAITAFETRGLVCLVRGSSRPHPISAALPAERAEDVRALLHRSPESADLREAHQPVDAGSGRRGELRGGADRDPRHG